MLQGDALHYRWLAINTRYQLKPFNCSEMYDLIGNGNIMVVGDSVNIQFTISSINAVFSGSPVKCEISCTDDYYVCKLSKEFNCNGTNSSLTLFFHNFLEITSI